MKKATTSIEALASVSSIAEMKELAWEEVKKSFDRFCLMAGIDSLNRMFAEDAEELCGPRYGRGSGKNGHRWGTTRGRVGFHGGMIEVERPRVRDRKGKEIALASWEAARDAGFLEQWAVNLTLMNVAMRKFGRAVRLPEGAVPAGTGAGLSKSAVSRRFVALTEEKLTEWMSCDLSRLDLLVIQIDGMHLDENLLMIGAVGIDINGDKHPLGVMEGARDCQESCARGRFHYWPMNRSPNMTANWVRASVHSRGARFQTSAAWLRTRYSSFNAASSLGKWPRVLTARLSFEFSASMALVV